MKKMGLLGPPGTHSEAAAVYLKNILPEPLELVNFAEIFNVFTAVELGKVDTGFVPVENSLEGSINITLDTLALSDDLQIVRELVWPVHNHFMAKPGTDISAITKIFSHAQPVSQCRKYLRKNFPDAEICTVPSTARAAEVVAETPGNVAAICTERAGSLNGLTTLATDIQDNPANSTRFFEIALRDENFSGETTGDKTALVCRIDGSKSGILCAILEEFATRNVNLTRIESRPARTKLGEYVFFFDLEISGNLAAVQDSIVGVRKKSIWLKNLGTFPVIRAK